MRAGKHLTMTADAKTELVELYRQLDEEIARAKPRCDVSGRCCRFREFGHTLFLSRLEAELLFEQPPTSGTLNHDGCPYQIDGRCTARAHRPLGCRVYFCDPNWQARQSLVSETYLRRLKDLHDRQDIPWEYRPYEAFLHEYVGSAGRQDRPSALPILGDLS